MMGVADIATAVGAITTFVVLLLLILRYEAIRQAMRRPGICIDCGADCPHDVDLCDDCWEPRP